MESELSDSSKRAGYRARMMTTAIGLVVALPAMALAQQANPEPTAESQASPGAAPMNSVVAQSAAAPTAATQDDGIQSIVVTARRTSESAQSVPIAVTTVTAKDLKDLSVRDLIEIQKVTPGLLVTSSATAGRAKMTIRGQTEADSRLTADSSVGIYIDGVNIARDYGLRSSLVDIAQIEVLKGPQGTLFGKNTTGGALNITTQHPTYDRGGYIDAIYGSYNNRQLLGVVNLPIIEDKLAVRVVAQGIKRDGYGNEANGQQTAGDDNVSNARVLVRADPTDNVRILLSGDYVKQRNHGPNLILTKDLMLQNANTATGALGAIAKQLGLNPASAADRLTAYNAWKVYYDADQNGSFYSGFSAANPASSATPALRDNLDHYGYSADVAVDFGKITARSITSYRHLQKSYFQDADGTPFDLNFTQQDTTQQNFSQEFQLSSIHGTGLDWQLGLFYNRESGEEFAVGNTLDYINAKNANIQDAGVINSSKAAYAQAVYNVTPAFRVTGGIRDTKDTREMDSMNRVDSALAIPPALANAPHCNLLTPTLGGPVFPNCSYAVSVASSKATWLISADWRPIKEVMLYGSVSTGYRTGGFTYQGSSAVQPNVNALQAVYAPYRPETVTNYEVGFKSDLSRRLRVNGALYYQKYDDIQSRILDQVNGILLTLIRNAAKATLYGGEIEVTAVPIDRLNLTASAGYLHARYDEFTALNTAGVALDLSGRAFAAPKLTYNLGANYTIPLSNGAVRLSANYAWVDTFALVPEAIYTDSVTQKAYGLLDARVNWNIKSQGIDIAIFGKNLADKQYITNANAAEANGWNFAIPGSPRTLGLQVRKTF